jgi:hypothetical protein
MSTKHKPDHEMEIMRRGLRDLAALSLGGRRRVLAYWGARIEAMPPDDSDARNPQQLDIEDVPQMPPLHVGGGLAA